MIQIKRIYEAVGDDDGARILVDRLWPRGISKEKAQLTLWLKEIAPSDDLRKWFDHDPKKWEEFKKRYKKELSEKNELIEQIRKEEKTSKVVTLLYAAKDPEHNQARVLHELLRDGGKREIKG